MVWDGPAAAAHRVTVDDYSFQRQRVTLQAQYTTTLLMLLPSCIKSKPLLMSARGIVCVIIGSISILPAMYQSTILGTSVRPRAPPKAVPFQMRPVTNWNGRVAISSPAGATPMMMDWPQPRCHAPSA